MTNTPRILIVNADDFGLSSGVTRGIIDAHLEGIVTSASLMVRRSASLQAAARAAAHPSLSIGLHVDLGEWRWADGEWHLVDRVVSVDDEAEVRREVERQHGLFRQLIGREPTHLDSHQHVHRDGPLRTVLGGLSRQLAVPLRQETSWVEYCGAFYGQTGTGEPVCDAVGVEHLLGLIEQLPTGITELACHPGYTDDLDSAYASERMLELNTLRDPRVRAAITRCGVSLRSFAGIAPNH